MLQWLLPDYSTKYKLVWQVAVGFLVATTILAAVYGGCYSDVARAPAYQGIPWAVSILDQSQLASGKQWNRSAVCGTLFDVFNPAWVDGMVISLPANSLLLVSLLSQLVLKRNPKKIPEATIIGLLLLSVATGCLIKGIHINLQLGIFSYPAVEPLFLGAFVGLYLVALLATCGTVYMTWPVKDASQDWRAPGPEEIALQRLDGDNLPPMIRPMLPPDASSCDQDNHANDDDDDDDDDDGDGANSAHHSDMLAGIF